MRRRFSFASVGVIALRVEFDLVEARTGRDVQGLFGGPAPKRHIGGDGGVGINLSS